MPQRAVPIGEAVVPHSADVAFEHRGQAPPPDGKDARKSIVAAQSRHLPLDLSGKLLLPIRPARLVRRTQDGIEAAAVEIKHVRLIAGIPQPADEPLGDLEVRDVVLGCETIVGTRIVPLPLPP